MLSLSEECTGLCEVGLSAVRGAEVAYPYGTTTQQFASEKQFPFDFSHLNINGRVFGAIGAEEDSEKTTVESADTTYEIGYKNKIKLKSPIVLPAMVKLNWKDYYSGAAMAGVLVVIGENAIKHDPNLMHDNDGKVSNALILGEMIEYFRKYDKGYGDIALQVNADDISVGTAEYALKNFDLKTIEIKFGQAAKGIQHVAPIDTYAEAVELKNNGYLVIPNPFEQSVKDAYDLREGFYCMQYGRLPMWNESILENIINKYRDLGADNILFKMAGYDIADIRRVLKIAAKNKIALVTFDGAGGGTGHSPCKMMNEWSLPTINLEKVVNSVIEEIKKEEDWIPEIAIAGGIAMEDTMFKALALGAPNINMVGIGRAAMAAAMSGKNMGELILNNKIPETHIKFGNEIDTIFKDAKLIKSIYKDNSESISYGAIGLYSYLNRLTFGMKLLMTLNRKFGLKYLDKTDVIPLTKDASEYLS